MKAFDAEVELLKSGGGKFEVTLGEDLIFSKLSLSRFPEEGELAGLASANQ